jgi:hypothetical protein
LIEWKVVDELLLVAVEQNSQQIRGTGVLKPVVLERVVLSRLNFRAIFSKVRSTEYFNGRPGQLGLQEFLPRQSSNWIASST